jgi:hypothetical protein
MKAPDLTLLLVAAAVSGLAVLIWCTTAPLRAVASLPTASPAHAAEPPNVSAALTTWAAVAPFRRNRQPAAKRFDAGAMIGRASDSEPQKAPRPQLILRGIVLGATPIALIEGLPGIEGARSVRQGEQVGGLRIRSVEHAKVRVADEDTTWTLVIREPGK